MTKFHVMNPYILAPWSPTFDVPPDGPGRGAHLRAVFANIARLLAARSPLFGAFYLPLYSYLIRTSRRLIVLLDAIAAGTLRAPRQRLHRPRASRPATFRLPAKKDWLGRTLGWEIRGYASQLETILNNPENQALLLREPARAARLLRPLARMLGIAPVALPPPPTPRKPGPRKPSPRKPRARRPTRAEIIASLHYPNLEGRPMRLLPPRKRR